MNAGLRVGIGELRTIWENERRDGDDDDNDGDIMTVLTVMMSFHTYQDEFRLTAKMVETEPEIVIKVLRDLKASKEMVWLIYFVLLFSKKGLTIGENIRQM